MTRIVIHVWTDLTDQASRTALENLSDAIALTGYNCELEHHALPLRHSRAHEFIYLAKSMADEPVGAARNGMAAVKAIGVAHDNNLNVDDPDTLRGLCAPLGIDPDVMVDSLANNEFATVVETDQKDAERMRAEEPPLVIIGGIIASQGLRTTVEYRSMLDQVAETLGAQEKAAAEEAEEIRRAGRAE